MEKAIRDMRKGELSNLSNVNKPKRLSFMAGWLQVRNGDMDAVKNELCKVLSVTNKMSWGRRLNGEVLLTEAERMAVEAVFLRYGISDVWS